MRDPFTGAGKPEPLKYLTQVPGHEGCLKNTASYISFGTTESIFCKPDITIPTTVSCIIVNNNNFLLVRKWG